MTMAIIIDPVNGINRRLHYQDCEFWCENCNDFELERIGYNYCDSPNDAREYGQGGICCACANCDGCFWACPNCGHGRAVQ